MMLRKDAVPSQFMWTKPTPDSAIQRSERARKRLLITTEPNHKHEKDTLLTETNQFVDELSINEVTVECLNKDAETQCEIINDTYRHDKITKTVLRTAMRIETYKQESKHSELNFYTGFDNYEHFSLIFSLLGDVVNHLHYYPTFTPQKLCDRLLSPENEFFLTIIKLRRNMVNKELAFRFEISEATVSRTFITWINFLYCQFKELNIWIPHKIAEENMRQKGEKCTSTIIIDCTEFKIQKPQNPVSQQLTYSTYKSTNTLKVLIGISSIGSVTFISDAYGGTISDRVLFEKSGLIELLEKKDIVLADRGFQIQDLLIHKDITVNIPDFLKRHSGQLEPYQLERSKKISSQRIHVERIIGIGKTYKILSLPLTSNLVPLASRIIFVCFMLVNLRSNIMEGTDK